MGRPKEPTCSSSGQTCESEGCLNDELARRCESLQARLHQLERELEHTHRLAALGTIVGSIAHEFNNLLTPVISYAELAKLHPEDIDLSAKALDRAAVGAEHASQIASAILDLVRRTDRTSAPPNSCVRDVLERALFCMAREPSQDGIALRLDVDEKLRAEIEPVVLQHVLLNILLNAVNVMRRQKTGGELCISAIGSTWNSTSVIEIRISDTGPGIDPARLEKIFEPFFGPAEPETSDNLSMSGEATAGSLGTGLGLSIAHRLVQGAGGKIEAESSPGQGATFIVTLPQAAVRRLRHSA